MIRHPSLFVESRLVLIDVGPPVLLEQAASIDAAPPTVRNAVFNGGFRVGRRLLLMIDDEEVIES